jgi:hypothetical protein
MECTQSYAAPIVDVMLGLAGIGFGIAELAAQKESCPPGTLDLCDSSSQAHEVGAIFVGLGILSFASALYGFSGTSACSNVIDTRRACREGSNEACARLDAVPATTETRHEPAVAGP